jgi:hypothetical protein
VNLKTKFQSFRQRMNRRAVALLAIFAIALSGTGLASLAVLQQTLTVTIVGTATTIDFRVNNTTPTLSLDFGLLERGDIRYQPLHLTNSGTGYVAVSTNPGSPGGGTNPLAVLNTQDITTTTKLQVFENKAVAECFVGSPTADVPDWNVVPLISAAPIFGGSAFNIPAGGFKDICLAFQIGGDVSLGSLTGTNFDALWRLKGFYP